MCLHRKKINISAVLMGQCGAPEENRTPDSQIRSLGFSRNGMRII